MSHRHANLRLLHHRLRVRIAINVGIDLISCSGKKKTVRIFLSILLLIKRVSTIILIVKLVVTDVEIVSTCYVFLVKIRVVALQVVILED